MDSNENAQIEERVGEGGYAVVTRSGQIAIKRIKWLYLESAIRELIFIKSCSHRCIITINEIFAEPENIALSMRFYPFVLTTYKIRGIADVVSLSYGLICACEYIHALGIIHSDIKCDNILVNPEPAPRPILCDFGISLRIEERQHVGAVQTVTYRAPEVNFNSSKNLHSPKIDVWSVGAVIFRMIVDAPMYSYISGCEDSSVYASRFFNTTGDTRKARIKKLYELRSTEITAALIRKINTDVNSLLYQSGIISVLTCALHPNPTYRSTSKTLADVLTKIIKKSFPEIRSALKFRARASQKPRVKIRFDTYPIDELECVINVPIEVIGSCSSDCLNYAETILRLYRNSTGIHKMEATLACIYIASATYCDSNALRAILTVMDMEQVQKYVIAVLREL